MTSTMKGTIMANVRKKICVNGKGCNLLKTSSMAVKNSGVFLIEDKIETRKSSTSALEKIYILPDVVPDLLKALEMLQLHLEQYYKDSEKANDYRRKIFYAGYLEVFPILEKLGTSKFNDDAELKELVLRKYNKVTEDLKMAFDQFRVDGNSRRVIETDRLIDDIEKIKKVARKYNIEI